MDNLKNNFNSNFNSAHTPLIVSFSLGIGIIIGLLLSSYQFPKDDVRLSVNKYGAILNVIEKEYVDTVDVNTLFEESVQHMLSKLDPHSSYVAKEDFITKSVLDSDFEGIGIRYFYLRDTLFVANVVPNGPSEKAGLLNGDRILAANDSSLINITNSNTIYNLLRGKAGSEVNLLIHRKRTKETFNLKVKRGKIPNEAADIALMINDSTGYARLNRFSSNSHIELQKQIKELLKENMSQLILDLRDNGGGYLNSAVEICDLFLAPNQDILYTISRGVIETVRKAKNNNPEESIPLIILINENSASASEIVSGALQDNDRALILGRRSFGKGLVQTPFILLDESEIRLTTSRYHTPSGRNIQKPYSDSEYSYQDDYRRRIERGELFSEDSVLVNDSLLFKTKNGRSVYGGGGIHPDIFIPEDTSQNTVLLSRLFYNQVIMEYATIYAANHQQAFSSFNAETFISDFHVTEELIQGCLTFARDLGIETPKKEINISKEKIREELKIALTLQLFGDVAAKKLRMKTDSFITESLLAFPKIELLLGYTEGNQKK